VRAGIARDLVADARAGTRDEIEDTRGRSASTTHSASATPGSPSFEAGVQTTVLPHASAGAINSAGMVYGQFHGVMTR